MALLTELMVAGPLTAAMRSALADDLARAHGAVVLVLSSAGLPLDEAGDAGAAAEIAALCNRLADRPASVAVLEGQVGGAALELALAARMRVAEAGAIVSSADIALGLVPAAGGTQRLPRLVGGAEALRMLLTGEGVPAAQALATGLVDQVAQGDARAAGRALSKAAEPARRGLRDGRGYLAAVAAARDGVAPNGAAARMIDCVEMALLLPLEQGLAYERGCFDDLAQGEDARGLRHTAQAFATAGGGAGAVVQRLGIWGGGAGAGDLVCAALRAGFVVQLAAEGREAVVRLLADVAERQEAAVQAGTLSAEARDGDWARLLPQIGLEGLGGVDLAVLTAPADVAVPAVALGFAPAAGQVGLVRFDNLAEVKAGSGAPSAIGLAVGFAQGMGWETVLTGSGGAVALRLAAALSDAVLWCEGQGLARTAIARSLATAGIAGESGQSDGVADETAQRCLAALANAGARAIGAGEAPGAAHVDAVAVAAGLMARRTGGPMHQANRRGLLVLRRDLQLWAAEDPALWSPAPLVETLAAEGRGFS